MSICLVRHGIALDVGEKGITCDEDRPLSEEGVQSTSKAAEGLKVLGVKPSRIVSSPLLRARQTADILSDVLTGGECKVEELDLLVPEARASETVKWLERCSDDSLMLVGHLPSIARIASLLVSGTTNARMAFRKAAACMIVYERGVVRAPGAGILEWMIQPKALRELGSNC